jgi:hypothetical protein
MFSRIVSIPFYTFCIILLLAESKAQDSKILKELKFRENFSNLSLATQEPVKGLTGKTGKSGDHTTYGIMTTATATAKAGTW